MSVIRRLFGFGRRSNGQLPSGRTGKMMEEGRFWKLVADSLAHGNSRNRQEAYLVSRLEVLVPEEIIGFRLRTDKLLYDTYNSNMWCAAYIINGGCSDDGFEYFRCWVISRGREVYYKAKGNPDSLMDAIPEAGDASFESFWYVALAAFENKTGKDLYDYVDEDAFRFKEGNYPHIEFNWEEDDPGSMRAICPRLFDHHWPQ